MRQMKWLTPFILIFATVFILSACGTLPEKPTGLEDTENEQTVEDKKVENLVAADSEKDASEKKESKKNKEDKTADEKKTKKDHETSDSKKEKTKSDNSSEQKSSNSSNKKSETKSEQKDNSSTKQKSENKNKQESKSSKDKKTTDKKSTNKESKKSDSNKKSNTKKEEDKPKKKEDKKEPPNDSSSTEPESGDVTSTIVISVVISPDEVPLKPTEFKIEDDTTVLDALIEISHKNNKGFHMDYRGDRGAMGYVEGIGNVYELDRGPGSGWMFRVNGIFPNKGAGVIHLRDGDRVEWLYTTNLGEDLNADLQPFR